MSESKRSITAETAPKLERKHLEKNRRDNLKFLYNHLFSLLPTHLSLEGMTVPDQVGETVNYIKSLQNQLEKNKQKKQELQQQNITRKRPHSSSYSGIDASKQPLIQVLEMGSGMDVVLINGLEDVAAFHNIIRILHAHGLEVANATFQLRGNSTLQIVHQQGFGGTTLLYEKLKQVVNGSSCSEAVESESLDSWDYDIWGFPILETFQGQLQNPPPY